MGYEVEPIAAALAAARADKGLSQRALSDASGLPQAQISRIETGAVDLRLSSLVALARALDLEVMLVPSKALPAVQSVVRSSESGVGSRALVQAAKALQRLQRTTAALEDQARASSAATPLQLLIRELKGVRLDPTQIEAIGKLQRELDALPDSAARPEALIRALAQLSAIHNAAALTSEKAAGSASVKPAYTLDDDAGADA